MRERPLRRSWDMVDLKQVLTRFIPEKQRSHSQDVRGSVAKIFNNSLTFSKPPKSTAFKVSEKLFGQMSFSESQKFSHKSSSYPLGYSIYWQA